jgi:hypothetical protein
VSSGPQAEWLSCIVFPNTILEPKQASMADLISDYKE